jgi:predicted ester cyclase
MIFLATLNNIFETGGLMSEENKQLIRRWFEEVWNKGRADAIEEMLDENGIAHGLTDDPANPIKGPSGFRPFHTVFRQAFPNLTVDVEDVIAEGDKAVARCSVRGKHEGEFRGPSRDSSSGRVHRHRDCEDREWKDRRGVEQLRFHDYAQAGRTPFVLVEEFLSS